MSTERQSSECDVYLLTTFFGGDKRGKCLQITGLSEGYVQLTMAQAKSLVLDLLDFIDDKLKEQV